jgi:serine/threonine protein kinase
MSEPETSTDLRGHDVTIGRYLLHRQIARGGMATIHIARLMGDEGFSRIVAAKRLLPEFAEDTEFVAMFMDEARIASKVHHRNVVPVLDLVATSDEVMLVQDYVHGVPVHWLLRTARQNKTHIPVNIGVSIACQVLAGLHAAHETVDELGSPLNIVHRDVSPQNVMIAVDGTARLLDFGVAKATMAAHVTRDGQFKGKLAYSAPEQLRGAATRQSDVYSLAVVLWELIVGHRMHQSAQAEAELITTIMNGTMPSITEALASEREWETIDRERWKQLEAVEPIIKKGLAIDQKQRWMTAADMEAALIKAVTPATSTDVAVWVKALGKEFLEGRDKVIAAEEASWRKNSTLIIPRTSSRDLTPRPSRLGTVAAVDTNPAAAMPLAPHRNKTTAVIALLGALVILLSVGIGFTLRGGSNDSPKTPPPAAPPPRADPTPVQPPAAAVAKPTEATVVRPTPPPAPAETAPEPVAREVTPPPTPTTRPANAGVTRTKVRQNTPRPMTARQASPAAAAEVKARPPATPVIEKAATPPPVPATDCNPPYYFDSAGKKIFKSACL